MFPVPPPYSWDRHLDPFDDQISMGDVATTSGYQMPYSPEGATVQMAAAASGEEYYASAVMQQQSAVFAGMEAAPPPCALLEVGGVGASYHRGGIASCGEGPHGFFYAGGVGPMGPDVGMVGPDDVAEYQRMDCGFGLCGQEPAYSAGNLQVMVGGSCSQHLMAGSSSGSPTPLLAAAAADISTTDDSGCFKVGRLSVEERKEKIHRYMKKRNERNFTKKIKYACRKTLADNRPRVRGRFAKNDEFGEVVVKEEDILDDSDILAHVSGVDSFNYNCTLESWI